ncbi:S24/S26 family peptidase [Pullulanibacillus sp. KACC 23026]|uniref:S24/S26 family peptidase n=1 Tax=Pullulanibacillus sp. KACC 23026 TaxID=3028315 RepID=UPI0023AEDBE6|nr:S24/S26 family peptidase [Pullulanibacillus sp. KACC 23026]WEG11492.1 S24/S26 family peptidase [Pullulanibacillus sp. KACC 23026]
MLANRETIQMVYQVVESKGYIDIEATGSSMSPFIRDKDKCRFIPFKTTDLAKGDVILYINANGELIGHRFYKMTKNPDGVKQYWLKADNQPDFDEPVLQDQFIGRLYVIERKGRIMEPSDLGMRLWTALILNVPFVPTLLKRLADKKQYKTLSNSGNVSSIMEKINK